MDTPRRRRAPLLPDTLSSDAQATGTVPAAGAMRAVRRGLAIMLWTLPCAVVQGVLLNLPGRGKVRFPVVYWRQTSRLLGMELRVVGSLARPTDGRPVVWACNHSSWLDIPVLGGILPGCFIAKGEIARWPVINIIARLGRTVFVTRGRDTLGQERAAMADRLNRGDNLILFPEGTSSDGTRVLPFRSTFFSLAEQARPPVVQPVSVVYDRLGWLPAGRANRALFAWYGDMDLASHYWRLARWTGLRATIILHEPMDLAAEPLNRKQISQRAWTAISTGTAALRQNRPPPAPGESASSS